MTETDIERDALRVTRFVGAGRVMVASAAHSDLRLLDNGVGRAISATTLVLARLEQAGLTRRSAAWLELTPAGRALAAGSRRSGQVLPEGFGELTLIEATGAGDIRLTNLAESPLAQLARRRGKDGKAFLQPGEISAGERLRSDYTRGLIMPRMGANWVAAVATGRRGGAGGAAELTDAALAARLRVEKAIAAVGPELSGVLIDICCYLKGLERVEAERGWPARSAKIVLRSGLGVLSRHYDPRSAGTDRHILHWGASDFRPRIGAHP